MNAASISRHSFELLSLQRRVAVVTGAGSGIGRGIAICLAEMGAQVAILDKDSAGAEETKSRIASSAQAIAITCDVTNSFSCKSAVEQIVATFDGIDILCNNAGIVIRKDVTALAESEWDDVLDVSLKSIYLLSHETIPHMARRGGGSIINTGSGWSLKGGPKAAAYCAAKGGVLNLTRAMAIDHGPQNIRVNCVCPGDIGTPMLARECEQLSDDPDHFMREAANRPLGRVGTVADVANAVLFLASDMSKWITGSALVVDGGGLA